MIAVIPPHGGQPVVRAGVPLDRARAVVVMVHGRGAGPANILDLVPRIGHADVAYLAPAARDGTWYPKSFMAATAENEPGISSGIAVIHALIDESLAAGVPADRVMLLGFSQGGCLTSTAAQRRPDQYGAVIVFSGGLIGPPGTTWPGQGDFRSTPVFSPTTTYIAITTGAGPLIVIDVDTAPRSMPANNSSMSANVSTATPARPTSPNAQDESESQPINVGMSNATDNPC